MAAPIVTVEGLGKKYHLGGSGDPYGSLRESLTRLARGGPRRTGREEFWALRDVNFEVRAGDVLGVVGRNGAGKSTLLKVLSRITEPTAGRAILYGRVASLLEVGTGFHPELSGRENIFLNGALLGMSRLEIAGKFDEIVEFAEIERFVDLPVKRYSSGMYVRLAFAVAAHLQTDILFVDEVLAVGDASFQRRCLDKIETIGGEGRTVIFVSHNMPAVTRLCRRALLLEDGQVAADGAVHEVMQRYLKGTHGTSAHREWDSGRAPGNGIVRLRSARVRDAEGATLDVVDCRQTVGIDVTFDVLEEGHVLNPSLQFFTDDGTCAFCSIDLDAQWTRVPRRAGTYRCTAWVPGHLLAEGGMRVMVAISTLDPDEVHLAEHDAVAFQVIDPGDGSSARGHYGGSIPGIVRPYLQWNDLYIGATDNARSRWEAVG